MAKASIASSVESASGQARWRRARLVVGCILLACVAPLAADPTPQQLLTYRPRQEGVPYSTPAPDQVAACKVELVRGQRKGSGWLLKDPSGQPLRLLFDSNDDGAVHVWSYYKDGIEVYREIDTTFKKPSLPDQYRWINAGGTKWGIDENHTGRITTWKAISAEEASQELLQALITRDAARFQALLLTETEIKALELPADQAARLREAVKGAPARFQAAVSRLTELSAKTNWIHLESGLPACIPADQTGGRYDLIKYPRAVIMFETGGKSSMVPTGEMIQVGGAWRLIDGPGENANGGSVNGSQAGQDEMSPELLKLVNELAALDTGAPPFVDSTDAKVAAHHLRRADLLEKIVGLVKAEEREPWIKQVADSLATAAQASPAGDNTGATRLSSLQKQLAAKLTPGHALTAYVTYREIQTDYTTRIVKLPDFKQGQQEYVARLGKFVEAYPQAEDTPEALLQAGMACELLDKEVEARNWYAKAQKDFPSRPQGIKGAGAVRRLGLEGQPLKLAAPTLADPNVPGDIEQLRGKIAVVYYWASWNSQCPGDFTKLKALLEANKDVGLVLVNLDDKAEAARTFLTKTPAPAGLQLHQDLGLEARLATDYGILNLPTLFLVGKDGKVVSTHVQVATLEDEIKKLKK
jgi:thiol-disulfide isomerase/thioredoxin